MVASGSAVPVMVGALWLVKPRSGGETISSSGNELSISKVTESVAVLPDTSVAVMSTVWEPSASGAVVVYDQSPLALVVTVATSAPSMRITTVAPGSARPAIRGVESPMIVPSAGDVMNAMVLRSTMKSTVAVAVEPPAPIAITTTVCAPSPSASGGVKLKVPSGSTAVRPASTPSMMMMISAPGSPVPVMGGVASVTIPPAVGEVTTSS